MAVDDGAGRGGLGGGSIANGGSDAPGAVDARDDPRRGNDWVLSSPAFERLLAALAPDRAAAGERYERIRFRLTRLFAWRGCADADALTDRTFDRAARRLEEGAELTSRDPYAYLHGIALHVLQERWRSPSLTPLPDPATLADPRAVRSGEWIADEAAEEERERRAACLEPCLRGLPAAARTLLERYHGAEGSGRIRSRQALAEELGVTLNALRIQAYRLRVRMQACIEECAAAPQQGGKRIRGFDTSRMEDGPR